MISFFSGSSQSFWGVARIVGVDSKTDGREKEDCGVRAAEFK